MTEETRSQIARRIVRSRDKGVLATNMRGKDKTPYASLVLIASDQQGAPLIYISDIAEHTRNIRENPTVSLCVENTDGLPDPLSGGRVTLQGVMEQEEGDELKERFHLRHPQARNYSNAHGFFLFRMNVQRVHLVAGFGQIHWMGADEYLLTEDQTQAIAQSEFSMIEHMNEDHSDLLDLYAARILERSGYGWRLTGIDPEGFDLRYEERLERIPFPEQLTEPDSIKNEFIRLAKSVREQVAQP
jgi:putative heme iron utilization protein